MLGYVSLALTLLGSAFVPSLDSELPFIRTTSPKNGIHIVKINNAGDYDVRPIVVDKLKTAKDEFDSRSDLNFIVNAGFFDPHTGDTASYVVLDGRVVLDPHQNNSLMSNESLKPYMDRILNRGEFRVLNCEGKRRYDIAYHNDAVQEGCVVSHSVQAGPILDDRMDLEKEYFVAYDDKGQLFRDSISALKKVPRTAIGLKSNDIYIFIVSDEAAMTIEELSRYMKKKGMIKALAFDGGSSTSFENGDISVVSVGDGLGRQVKSFLGVRKPTPKQVKKL